MKTTIKAYQSAAVVVEPGKEALVLSITMPGKHVEEVRTAYLSDDAAEVLMFALEMALEARRIRAEAVKFTAEEHACFASM